MRGGGGEQTFLEDVIGDPPDGVSHEVVWDYHQSIVGARSNRIREIAFNRFVQPALWPLPGLRSYSVGDEFDLVHVHNYSSHIRAASRVPVVMTVGGGSYYHYIRDYLGWSEQRVAKLYRRAARIFPLLRVNSEFVNWKRLARIGVLSQFAADFLLRSGVPGSRIDVLPPGIPVRDPIQRPVSEHGLTFLFVGRDPYRKGADLFIGAIRRLRTEGHDVRAVLAGDPSYGDLDGEAGFEVHPWVDRSKLERDLYPRADVFVIASRAEGYGLVLIEAMSFGLPVIATDQGAFGEILGDPPAGVLVPVDDEPALASAMRTLVEEPDWTLELSHRSRARFEREFTRERFKERLLAFYHQALEGT